jgi:hypothetical protein
LKALHQAQESKDETENDILSSTHAVVFFGTPHRGSPYASIAQVVERAARILFSTNPKLLGNLGPDGEMLERVRMDFTRMLDEREIQAYSFQEAKGLSGIKFFSKKVRAAAPRRSYLTQKGRGKYLIENRSYEGEIGGDQCQSYHDVQIPGRYRRGLYSGERGYRRILERDHTKYVGQPRGKRHGLRVNK